MLYVNENTNEIQLTRGDTAYLTVPLVSIVEDEVYEYEMASGDKLTFTVRVSISDPDIKLQKEIIGHNEFKISPDETAILPYSCYRYDIQLNKANGDVYTVIPPSRFTILPEVTY